MSEIFVFFFFLFVKQMNLALEKKKRLINLLLPAQPVSLKDFLIEVPRKKW